MPAYSCDRKTGCHDYSCRQWAGLLSSFYKQRWIYYFDYLRDCMAKHKKPDQQAFEQTIRDWEWNWVNSRTSFPDQPHGNTMQQVQLLYRRYRPLVAD
ncbi:MAG: hypothetical protein EOO09_07130 [Chitinophagaceae bacterium]|nr:MAG: hypothetical protein EOO09_07130 [Chitinophagaceae bacterium]